MKKRKSPELKNVSKQKLRPKQGKNSPQLPSYVKKDVLLFTFLAIIIFIVIRSLYPVPDYIPDSKGYLLGSLTHEYIGYRPMGISLFLTKMYKLSPSLVFVAWAQFVLHVISALMITHAFFSIYPFKPLARKVLLAVAFLNIPILQLANTITSDSLFISLTVIWIALGIFIIRKPNFALLALVLFVLWLSVFIRYNALIYPVVMIAGLLFVKNRPIMIVGSLTCILLVWGFYSNITHKMVQATGTNVLSGFSGWQLASNAMKAYKALDEKGIDTDDKELLELDKNVIRYIDSTKNSDPAYIHSFTTDFMWSSASPFVKAQNTYAIRTRQGQFVSWTKISLVLQKYGQTIIKKYPVAFLNYYFMPNMFNFFSPELELLAKYTAPEIKLWGKITNAYKTPEVTTNEHTALPLYFNTPFRILYTVVSILFIVFFLRLIFMLYQWDISREARNALCFTGIYFFCKLGFEVLAAPVTFRYVLMTMPVLTGAVLIMMYVKRRATNSDTNV